MKFNADNLRQAREIRKMSLVDVENRTAELYGFNERVRNANISQIENRQNENPGYATVEKLAAALDFPWYYFFFENGQIPDSLLPDMPEDVLKFIMDADNLQWIQLGMIAKKSSLSYKSIQNILDETRPEKLLRRGPNANGGLTL